MRRGKKITKDGDVLNHSIPPQNKIIPEEKLGSGFFSLLKELGASNEGDMRPGKIYFRGMKDLSASPTPQFSK